MKKKKKKLLGMPKMTHLGFKNAFLKPLNNRYFCHIAIIKWSQIGKKIYQKVLFQSSFLNDQFGI